MAVGSRGRWLLTWTDHAVAVDTLPCPKSKDDLPLRMACFQPREWTST
jgi:hypothetical protein